MTVGVAGENSARELITVDGGDVASSASQDAWSLLQLRIAWGLSAR